MYHYDLYKLLWLISIMSMIFWFFIMLVEGSINSMVFFLAGATFFAFSASLLAGFFMASGATAFLAAVAGGLAIKGVKEQDAARTWRSVVLYYIGMGISMFFCSIL